jgi:hypothetical protein
MVNIKLHTLDVHYFTYYLLGRKPSTNCIVLHLEKLSLGMISSMNSFLEILVLQWQMKPWGGWAKYYIYNLPKMFN